MIKNLTIEGIERVWKKLHDLTQGITEMQREGFERKLVYLEDEDYWME